MRTIELIPLPLEIGDGYFKRICEINRFSGDNKESTKEFWIRVEHQVPEGFDETDCSAYLLAMIFDAMAENRNIVIRGAVDRALLMNLTEFMAAWSVWLPDSYSFVDIKVDLVIEKTPVNNKAVCAYSGGVDATFTVNRHVNKTFGFASLDLSAAVLVHGFDIDLDNTSDFDIAFERCKQTLKDVGIPLIKMSTNYRKISPISWEHSVAALISSALSSVESLGSYGLIASSEPYDALVLPWGTSPMTEHLLSSSSFRIIHDGADNNRTEKVSKLAQWPQGVKDLRVCWEGENNQQNCGKCEKCVRTKLNFLASGQEIPDIFDKPGIEMISNTILRTDMSVSEWGTLVATAKSNKVDAPWVKEARKLIFKSKVLNKVLPGDGKLRYKVRRLLIALGIHKA
ncbi:hypothetical protein DBZ36_17190 [Alginatibacterium sediminis]|uniref:Uncharacterized protein n=1 Tax=Alginatibacterium sediminis TaxID=2164068 RepID=A0A420E7H6_9ALTE|nr:hypothetical protein [Alginatibacterium sediminis]RKF14388.1 hypothetical protein DBZ36_17190 [Alginatibacterium sediminis]